MYKAGEGHREREKQTVMSAEPDLRLDLRTPRS